MRPGSATNPTLLCLDGATSETTEPRVVRVFLRAWNAGNRGANWNVEPIRDVDPTLVGAGLHFDQPFYTGATRTTRPFRYISSILQKDRPQDALAFGMKVRPVGTVQKSSKPRNPHLATPWPIPSPLFHLSIPSRNGWVSHNTARSRSRSTRSRSRRFQGRILFMGCDLYVSAFSFVSCTAQAQTSCRLTTGDISNDHARPLPYLRCPW